MLVLTFATMVIFHRSISVETGCLKASQKTRRVALEKLLVEFFSLHTSYNTRDVISVVRVWGTPRSRI